MSTAWVECWKCDECGHRWIKTPLYPERCPSRACRKRSWNKNQLFIPADPTSAADVDKAIEASRIARDLPTLKPDMEALRAICSGNVQSLGSATTDPKSGGPADRGATQTAGQITEVPICGKTWWEDGEHWECLMDAGHKESKHGMREMVRRLE